MENQPAGGGPMPERPVPERPEPQRPRSSIPWMIIVLAVALFASALFFKGESGKPEEISYGKFVEELKAGHVAEASVSNQKILGKFKPGYVLPKKEADGQKTKAAGKAPKTSKPKTETTGKDAQAKAATAEGKAAQGKTAGAKAAPAKA